MGTGKQAYDMAHPRLFLHLGIPKAASTYLQTRIFPNLEGIRYYRKKYFKQFPDIVNQTPPDDGPLLFSSEMYDKLATRAEKIGQSYPDAKVILVFRRQDRWIRSKYKYYLWKNGNLAFREFLDMYEDQGLWKQDDLYFRPKVEAVEKHFRQKPLVLLMEDLYDPNGTFLQRLEAYTQTTLKRHFRQQQAVKTAFDERQLTLLRRFNQNWPRVLKQTHLNVRQGLNFLVAFSAALFPEAYFHGKQLVPSEDLERIRTKYDSDWAFIQQKAKEPIEA